MGTDGRCPYKFDDVDDTTATLVLKLHISDIEELSSTSKGKGREGEISDADLALLTYQIELREKDRILADRRMARSLSQAVLSDAATVTEVLREEDLLAKDRAMAHGMAGTSINFADAEQIATDCGLDDSLLARLATLYVSGGKENCDPLEATIQSSEPSAGESSAWASSRRVSSITPRHRCIACNSERLYFDICRTPCSHYYCQECLHTLFELSTTDETLYPPRCCRQVIPLQSARLYLDSALIHTFEEKSVEFESSDRTYCCQPTCSSFITPTTIVNERATCAVCGTSTCTICKSNAHNGDCPEDAATQQILETAKEEGWQRCYSCRRLVELDVGCNHIT